MDKTTPLIDTLARHLPWHRSRIDFLAKFVIALLRVGTVNLTRIARAFSGNAQLDSNYKRIRRFLKDFEIDYNLIADFVVRMFPLGNSWILCIDRTNWKFGKSDINLLVLAVAYKGIAIPLFWDLLPKRGNSDTEERIRLMDRFLKFFPKERIRCLTADREFIGREWITWLRDNNIPFRIRIRNNTLVPNGRGNRLLPARSLFRGLTHYEVMVISKKRPVWNIPVHIVALKIDGEYVIIITEHSPHQALDDYKQRWQIETLFGCLKTRGFDMEDTHLTDPERISRLMAILTLTFCWCYKIGDRIITQKPIEIKKHGRRAKSIFRIGLDRISSVVLNLDIRYSDFIRFNKFLSCT